MRGVHWTEYVSLPALAGMLAIALLFLGASILPRRAWLLRDIRVEQLLGSGQLTSEMMIACAGVGVIFVIVFAFAALWNER